MAYQNGMNGFTSKQGGHYPQNNSYIDPGLIQALLASMQSNMIQPPLPASTPEKDSSINLNGEFCNDQYNSQIFRTPSSSMNNETRALCELQRKALRGCESAARIADIHGKRPYFKKIDLLCSRVKTDLCVTDKAVININSHGVAWAIKDFIFVFNRIISAWVILRDYFYSNSEGMKCVNESIDPNFYSNFVEWQNATSKLTTSLIQSYENLNSSDHRNGNRQSNKGSDSSCFHSPSSFSSNTSQNEFNKIFDPLIVENSEQAQHVAQRKGGYLKSAIYKPLSSSEASTPLGTPNSASDFESLKFMLTDLLPDDVFKERSNNPLYKRGGSDHTYARSKTNLVDKFGMKYTDASFSDLGGITPIIDETVARSLESLRPN